MKALVLLLALAALPAPAQAGVSGFIIVNGTDAALADVTIRRAGTESWTKLGATPSPGANQAVDFKDRDCAFDIRADVGGKPVTWAAVNLCEVKSVTLKSDSAAGPWVDYDAP